VWRVVALLAVAFLLPAAAHAQGTITGVVKDTSDAVLPGVTVEAASPSLIEKVRTVVSDDGGQYRLVGLPPGEYSVTFTLAGFNTFKRDGIQIVGDFTATINAEMRVGALEETITVTGEAPIVDVQGVQRQHVLTNEVAEAVPTGKYFVNLGVLIPGVTASCSAACQGGNSQDTGGDRGDSSATLVAHGSRFRDQRISINNVTVRGSTGYLGVTGPNIEAQQETQIDTSGADASVGTGGVRINVVPKDGGNVFSGGMYFTGTNEKFQWNNIDQDLRDRGLAGTTKVKYIYDIAPTFGGPIKKDKLWFFASWRRNVPKNYAANLYFDKNRNNPNEWAYVPDLTKQVVLGNTLPMAGMRLTWQANATNRFGASFDYRDRCQCPNLISGGTAPEASINFMFRPQHVAMVTWSSPVTNKLLLEAVAVDLIEGWGNRSSDVAANVGMIRVVGAQNIPQSFLGITNYRGPQGGNWTWYPYRDLGFSATYVTGAHAFKAGIEYDWGWNDAWITPNLIGPITSVRINMASGKPVPNQFTVNAGPVRRRNNAKYDGGIYIQDKWTINRVTLSGGLRWEYFNRYTPEITLGPALLIPDRNITFPKETVVNYRDLSPRMGVAWDVFGTGKTALKASLNRYTQDLSLLANSGGSQLANYQDSASRTWTDNGNFVPECNYTNPAAQDNRASGGDFCGAFTGDSANFNLSRSNSVNDPNTTSGFNKRGYNWEFSTELQQELVPQRLAVNVAFFRRWYGNVTVTDNRSVTAADYTAFSIVVPTDDRLPNSGKTISGFLDANPNVASLPTDNFVTYMKNYGDFKDYWQGYDLSASYRIGRGALIQGGLSAGQQVIDQCEVFSKVPEAAVQSVSLTGANGTVTALLGGPYCRQEQPFLMQIKGLGTYTIPGIDLQVSGTFQTVPGPQLQANYAVPAADVIGLGRALAGNASNVTINLIEPGTKYGDRLYQTDFRVGKVFRFLGTRRVTTSIDLFNVFNGNVVLTNQNSYSLTNTSLWLSPITVQQARLLKFTVSASF
jgi:hypothetical protein